MDEELFNLCKQVYKATKWGRMDNGPSTNDYYLAGWVTIGMSGNPDVVANWKVVHWEEFDEVAVLHMRLNKGHAYPLYTSDYIAGRLPKVIADPAFVHPRGDDKTCVLFVNVDVDEQDKWLAGYDSVYGMKVRFSVLADTPLKALLKLTLALHKEGLLK